ncbi:Pkr1-domain-containing protein [Daldinia loculata]|uniref:Pkr1-domain-containing protein n=1 Tax=Daldinia loculata TaxID=103429 RepID=UPI0020C1C3B8|nr:Pkr1-domain-containing protein [Daldinia loculata]KAI1645634.1 Pkr1-domain-containing protein [Daldinia loculata]KAI2784862.1 Pkr1-domain-containing protein [Daldinia loculata]
MAGFATDLWESIFTPGTTPTLLVATNATFACLQLVLLLLLVGTYSIHFVILSFLCGGLWWAINWFAAELRVAQAKEARDKARSEQRAAAQSSDESEETEVETAFIAKGKPTTGSKEVEVIEQTGDLKLRTEPSSGTKSSVSTEDEWEKVSENENEKDK